MSNDLSQAKQRLLDKLGPNYNLYIQLLGRWFRGLISKEEFDKSAKQLIKQNFVLEHNKFWLAFFHHCANSTSSSIQAHNFHNINDVIEKQYHRNHHSNHDLGGKTIYGSDPDSIQANLGNKIRCLPNKVITHMKIFVIAWEMGLDSASDNVSLYINLALQHFLKNIITELICTKTAYRLRENRFKYAIGVKPINPYLSNSLKIYSSNLEYDPYQIESNKMNCSLVDTYAYNDSLFPSRLYEAQALYEYACSATIKKPKKLKLTNTCQSRDIFEFAANDERKLTLFHLLIAFLSNRTIIPSQSLYSINLERIFTKLNQR